jgi:hypothetical protein
LLGVNLGPHLQALQQSGQKIARALGLAH